jgi:hypothetical protein
LRPHHYVVPLHDVVPCVPFRSKKKLLTQPPLAISTETKALAKASYSESPELQEDRIPNLDRPEMAKTFVFSGFRSNKLSLLPK